MFTSPILLPSLFLDATLKENREFVYNRQPSIMSLATDIRRTPVHHEPQIACSILHITLIRPETGRNTTRKGKLLVGKGNVVDASETSKWVDIRISQGLSNKSTAWIAVWRRRDGPGSFGIVSLTTCSKESPWCLLFPRIGRKQIWK